MTQADRIDQLEAQVADLQAPAGGRMRIGTAAEAAELLKVHKDTVYRWAQEGKIPSLRRLGPRVRFDLEALEQWMQQGGQSS